jgi:adenylylsulfate kinase
MEKMSGVILWFTGLSGSGKSTLAHAVATHVGGVRPVEILDGDEVRTHLSKGLGFTKADRDMNVRRIGFVARLLARHQVFVITAAISPYAEIRDEIRALAERESIAFVEVYLKAQLDSLIVRDVKGLYRRALAGEIPFFTGISDPYEPPVNPDLVVETDVESIAASTSRIIGILTSRGVLPKDDRFASEPVSSASRDDRAQSDASR